MTETKTEERVSKTEERVSELLSIFDDLEDVYPIVKPLIEELAFIEEQLRELKKQPFIKYHPKNPSVQKQTPAGKLYKELLAQQKDIVRILCGQLRKVDKGESSPLREYLDKLDDM